MKIFNRSRFYLYGTLSLILIGVIVVILSKKYNFATDEPFIIVTNYSAGPDDYRNMYDETIAIHNDGRLVLYSTGNDDLIIGEDAPTLEIQLDGDQIEQVKETIKEKRFWKLPRDVSTPSEDGEFKYVTVNLANETKKVGGLNPDHEQFSDIFKAVWDSVPDDDYQKWIVEIEEHIWEYNSLRHDKKTDFTVDEPFLVLSMETLTENLPYVYLQNISINMDGELVLYVESPEGSDMEVNRDIPELNIQLTANELEEVQELIKENFWKLNESIRNPDAGGRMESITVHLKEEEKTVRGEDPINPRFTAIRDFLIDLIDEKEYEAWIEEIVEELWEENVLDSDKKTDYNVEEPFLTLEMERYLGGNSLRPYYQNIAIDMEGNITLYANENRFKNIDKDAPIIEIQANDEELEGIKKLIEENFWELDERNDVPGGKEHMESITLKLTDDDMTVEGNDPDDRKFNAIRRAMIDFFDKEVYEKWEKKAEKYISESGPDF